MSDRAQRQYRRRFLQGIGATGVAGVLAGCTGGNENGNGNGDNGNGDPNGNGNGDNGNGDPNGNGNGNGDNGDDPEPAYFAVSESSATDVMRGETATVSATVENTGEEAGTQPVAFTFDGESTANTDLELDAGADDTVDFDVDTVDFDPADYDYTVSTDDEDVDGSLTIDPVVPGDPLLSLDELQLQTGTTMFAGTLENPYPVAIESGEVVLSGPEGWEVSAESGTTFETLEAEGTQDVSWEVTIPDGTEDDEYELTAESTYTADQEETVSGTYSVQVTSPLSAPYGINFGYADAEPPEEPIVIDGLEFEDVDTPDDLAQVEAIGLGGANLWEGVEDTDNVYLYETEWWANTTDFEFDLEFLVENGTYDVTFHFADPRYQEEGARVFDVSVQGDLFLEEYDIYVAAGGPTPVTETTEGVEVTDNRLLIETVSYQDAARLCALEIHPAE